MCLLFREKINTYRIGDKLPHHQQTPSLSINHIIAHELLDICPVTLQRTNLLVVSEKVFLDILCLHHSILSADRESSLKSSLHVEGHLLGRTRDFLCCRCLPSSSLYSYSDAFILQDWYLEELEERVCPILQIYRPQTSNPDTTFDGQLICHKTS